MRVDWVDHMTLILLLLQTRRQRPLRYMELYLAAHFFLNLGKGSCVRRGG